MARLILSAGMFSDLAARMAVRRRGLVSGSPPFLAAMEISLIRRVKILPRLASSAPFLCLIVAHFEWPDMEIPQFNELELRWFGCSGLACQKGAYLLPSVPGTAGELKL